jgi:ribosomal protein S27E
MEPEQSRPRVKVRRYRCPGCRADLLFEPQGGRLTCPHCGRIEEMAGGTPGQEEPPYKQYLQALSDQPRALAPNALEVKCEKCSATLMFTPQNIPVECNFCGSKILAQPGPADPLVAPESVLPFRLTDRESADRLKSWLKSRWFAPNALKQFAAYEGATGVYLPFWAYDTYATSHYTAERGTHYSISETYTEVDAQGRSVTRSREVQRTRWESTWGTVSQWFDDLLVPATKSLPSGRLQALEPWDLANLKPYQPGDLSGYKTQRYQVDLAEGFERAKELCANDIQQAVEWDIGGDERRSVRISTQYSAITAKHLLLPAYVGAYRFKGKVYQVVVNARTGEVHGERPYSVWKILLLVLLSLLAGAVVVRMWSGSWPGFGTFLSP